MISNKDMDNIKVSIICTTYNHEAYIRDALEGFIRQKTTFPFEVIVYDDASTDKTADIIREYEKNYPTIIKPIYENENQYSKKDGSLGRILYNNVKGKYIAVCEGDDYWINPLKLQKQVDLLESNPQIDICATGAKTELAGKFYGEIAPSDKDTIFTPEQVILGGGGFVATASLVFRAIIKKDPPPFMKILSLDYTTQVAGALRGGMLYIAERTCVYRLSTPGSWTMHMRKNTQCMIAHINKVIDMLHCLDEYTGGKYHKIIDERIKSNEFNSFLIIHDYKSLCHAGYRKEFEKLPKYKKLVIMIGCRFPQIADYLWSKKTRRTSLNG